MAPVEHNDVDLRTNKVLLQRVNGFTHYVLKYFWLFGTLLAFLTGIFYCLYIWVPPFSDVNSDPLAGLAPLVLGLVGLYFYEPVRNEGELAFYRQMHHQDLRQLQHDWRLFGATLGLLASSSGIFLAPLVKSCLGIPTPDELSELLMQAKNGSSSALLAWALAERRRAVSFHTPLVFCLLSYACALGIVAAAKPAVGLRLPQIWLYVGFLD